MKKSYENFLELVKKKCKKHGVKLDIRNTTFVKLDNIKCSGYFDGGDKPRLVVAGKRPDMASILVHEFAHLTQWVEGIELWDASNDSINKLTEWLGGKRIKNIRKHIELCRELELDNEKRASKYVKKYNLGIKVSDYIRRANAYVLFYNCLLVSRKWSNPKNSPYTNKNLSKVMSNKFDMDYTIQEKTILKPKILNVFITEKI